eukprot:CAMPEP_0116833600 /NCGR_PEP_ID=MMETSP0418-20121206/6526_1 /TAXON_ID=1158023 /ORGANISM="Astrosyne radiata, Strain 13vi08-1A" /LENGTH=87 /DNA_ID=CAMNT_0004463067 /DNA_START=619 /DNA_END=882 /DNA_ORIENTATION=-
MPKIRARPQLDNHKRAKRDCLVEQIHTAQALSQGEWDQQYPSGTFVASKGVNVVTGPVDDQTKLAGGKQYGDVTCFACRNEEWVGPA